MSCRVMPERRWSFLFASASASSAFLWSVISDEITVTAITLPEPGSVTG